MFRKKKEKESRKRKWTRRGFLSVSLLGFIATQLWPMQDNHERVVYHSPGSPKSFSNELLTIGSLNLAGLRKRSLDGWEAFGSSSLDVSPTFHELMLFIENVRYHTEYGLDIFCTQEDSAGNVWNQYFNCFQNLADFFDNGFGVQFIDYETFGLALKLIGDEDDEGGLPWVDFIQANYSEVIPLEEVLYAPATRINPGCWSKWQERLIGSKGVTRTVYDWAGKEIVVDNFHLAAGDFWQERSDVLDLYLAEFFDPSRITFLVGDFNEDLPNTPLLGKIRNVLGENALIQENLGRDEYKTVTAINPDSLKEQACDATFDTIIGYSPHGEIEHIDYNTHQAPSDHRLVRRTFGRKW